jgi:hypothetical protein
LSAVDRPETRNLKCMEFLNSNKSAARCKNVSSLLS